MAPSWTQRVREAWQWVKSGMTRALGREPAFEEYVGGGGVIEQPEWDDAWRRGEDVFFKGGFIEDLDRGDMIIRNFFEVVDIDYAGKYHVSAEMGYFDKRTQSWEVKFVSANADEIMSRLDWEAAMVQAVKDTEESPKVVWEMGYDFINFLAEERM